LMRLQSSPSGAAEALKHSAFSTAAVIYYQALKDTQKLVGGAVKGMTIELCEKVMDVCKATISTVGAKLFSSS